MKIRDRPARGSSIGGVERDTGLTKDTLRVWERRYGFPRPQRDAFGERTYSAAEVEKPALPSVTPTGCEARSAGGSGAIPSSRGVSESGSPEWSA